MNIIECYDLHSIVKELELALQIEDGDLRETDIEKLLDNVKRKINREYQVDVINYKVNAAELELSQMREATAIFIENITGIHAKLCGYSQVRRYLCTHDISLEDINYLGLTKESMKVNLIALQRACYQPRVGDFIAVLKKKLPTISNSWEKRLFVLAVVCEDLGFFEVTASIAEILYQSMV